MATRPAPPAPGHRARTSGSANTSRSGGTKPRIGQYIIERTLGTGSFGKVKRELTAGQPTSASGKWAKAIVATHSITGHQVALKLINRAKITTPDMNARVKREIQYLKVLRHPHIIKL